MQCFWGLKPYSHLPITLFITRGLVHTCIQGAHTPSVPSITHAWVLAHSAARAASHRCLCMLRTCRHTDMHQDVGVGLARAHTCTRRCARTHTATAQPASHTSSGAQRPLSAHLHKQHFFPSSRTHTRTPSAPAPAAHDRSPGAKTTSPGVSPAPSPGAPHPCLALPACGSPQQGGTSSP